ncbi:MAG: hypothetical protein GYA21_04285 [Myxococcales bacterium]|nr:hypothetical protein [Myxococcales bacterium]
MEPVRRGAVGETVALDEDHPILDGMFSDGLIETRFMEALKDDDELEFWLARNGPEVDRLLQDAIRDAKPGWPRKQVEQEASRLRRILERAAFFRLKGTVCHRGSEALRNTAADLRAIAGDRQKLDSFRHLLESRPDGVEFLKNLCGPRWDGSAADLRSSLLAQAARMDRLAEGLHVADLLHKEDPLRDMPNVARRLFEELPPGSFLRDAFPAQSDRYLKKREFERDALALWKGACSAGVSLAGSLGGVFAAVGKLYSLSTLGLDARDANERYAGATVRANAALLSGGASESDYRQAIGRRDASRLADNVALWFSFFTLAAGGRLSGGEKATLKLTSSWVKTQANDAPTFGSNSPGPAPERLDQLIHRLATKPEILP